MNIRILDILVREGVIQGFQVKGNGIVVVLMNSEIARQKLKNIRPVSRPSKQVYVRLRVLKHVYMKSGASTNSLTLVSTNSGITTIGEAVREGLGGEVLFAANAFVVEAIALAK